MTEYTKEMDGQNNSEFLGFLSKIGRNDLAGTITPNTPWAYFSQEIYREKEFGIKGAGGLGVLAADTTRVAEKLGMPLVVVTPFYSSHIHQSLTDFWHGEYYETSYPTDYEYEKLAIISISTKADSKVDIEVYQKQMGSVKIFALYEPNIGALYSGESGSDHRMYHEIITGFAGYKLLKQLGLNPPAFQLNEAPTVFAAVALLDDLLDSFQNFEQALNETQIRTIYTNHTLLPAAEGEFDISQFEHFVFPNIKHQEVIDWARKQFWDNGKIKLSTLAIELARNKNGVSILHSKLSSQNYKSRNGGDVEFKAVTNGISDHWIFNDILRQYQNIGAMDEFELPTENYGQNLENLNIEIIKDSKRAARIYMNDLLANRKNQYGEPIYVPEDAKLFDFKRRLVSYKRVKMIFEDMNRLTDILLSSNAYFLFSGKPPGGDTSMLNDLKYFLNSCDSNPILRERVHYIQDYDEEVGLALALGGDCAINVPIVGQEACGTSWMKDIANCKLLVSTTDGGVADVSPASYLEVTGWTYQDEVNSMYEKMEEACKILEDNEWLRRKLIKQLQDYLPIVSGSRMMRDYLNLRF